MFAHSKRSRFRLFALMVLTIAAALFGFAGRSRAGIETTTVIVEFRQEPAAVYAARAKQSGRNLSDEELQAYRAQVRAAQDEFLSALSGRGVTASVVSRDVKDAAGNPAARVDLRYTYVYNGLALSVPRSSVDALKAMPEVKRVQPNGLLYTALNRSVGYINAPKVYGAVKELTQFDDMREGFEGQGVNIAVLDTGIDWTHPMFGGDPTPPRLGVAPSVAAVNTNQKVIYYLPLTDIAANDGFGHGTHVASTAAGYLARHPGGDGLPNTADDVELHGVAPQAKLMSYTVCSNIRSVPGSFGLPSIGGCESADTIMALEDSVSPFTLTGQPKPVAHVINLSLGGSGGPDSPTAVACSNAALTGATVVASSGNSGPGEGTTGAPAAGTHVISVGATTHPGAAGSQWSADVLQASALPQGRTGAVSPADNFQKAAGFGRLTIFPMSGTASLPQGSMAQRYVFVNLPTGQWPASVAGRIALVKDALGATIFDIVAQAYNAGAVGVILFDDRGAVNGVKTLIPAATISPADGEILVDALSSTDNNSVDPPNGALSELPVRMNPFLSEQFMGEMGDFSSRGPVRGLGQIKPDVSAPGVAVLAAVPPASVLGGLAAALETTPNYMHLDGTSMSSPHTAGAVALIKQAHPDWSPDMIRTALINTATNMRNESGTPKAEGLNADSIIAQGGGLIDVPEALGAKALMGVAGDGIDKPAILGSHSYGEVPVIDSRVTHTESVPVTVRDLSGQGGTYSLGVANNRDLQLAGINVSVSRGSVTLPPNGEATFTVAASVDGDRLRDVMASKTNGSQVLFEKIQMQWFVTARRGDGAESLRMPFFFRPGKSMPAEPSVVTRTDTGLVPAGDAGAQRDALGFQPELNGVTYAEVRFDVDASTMRIEATTEWLELPAGDQPDLDYELVGPDGSVIISAGAPGGPEYVNVSVTQTGTYKHRVIGFANAATEFTITTNLTKGNAPPTLNATAGDFRDAQGREVDFDGAFTLSWQAQDGEQGYEVEHSTDNENWRLAASVGAGTTSLAVTDQPQGENFYRVRALTPGRIGFYVTPPSGPQSVFVDRRTLVDITAQTQGSMVPLTYRWDGATTQLEWTLTNRSASVYYPRVEMKIVRVNTSAGTITVANADNNGTGLSAQTAALFGYSDKLGAEQEFAPNGKTGSRLVKFNDATGQLFSFDAVVTAYSRAGGGAAAQSAGGEGASGVGSSSQSGGGGGLQSHTSVMRVTVNPLTKLVSVKLVSGVL